MDAREAGDHAVAGAGPIATDCGARAGDIWDAGGATVGHSGAGLYGRMVRMYT